MFWLNLTATTHAVADLKNVVDAMVTAYVTRLFPYVQTSYVQTGAKASWLYGSGTSIEYTGSYSNAGSEGGSPLNDATCFVINWSIPDYYRGGHPRTYLTGLGATIGSSGRIVNPTSQALLATAATNWISDVNALTHGGISAVALGTVRFQSGNAWLSPPVFRGYQSASVRSVMGTQRRRYSAY